MLQLIVTLQFRGDQSVMRMLLVELLSCLSRDPKEIRIILKFRLLLMCLEILLRVRNYILKAYSTSNISSICTLEASRGQ